MNPGGLAPGPALLGNRPYCQKLGLFAGEGGYQETNLTRLMNQGSRIGREKNKNTN